MKTMLSLSTAFLARSHTSWPSLLEAANHLGFSALELNVQIPQEWMPGIVASVERGDIRISSLHNYCPAIKDLPPGRTIYSGYLLTADDEEERRIAVQGTIDTISWARKTGAAAVVIHAGEVPMDPSGRDLFAYILQFGLSGKLYSRYYDAVRKERDRLAARYIEKLMRSLDAIIPAAQENGIVLGLENRFYLHEIPNTEETIRLLDRYAGAPVGYWHDTGHAEVFVRAGWMKCHEECLAPLSSKLVGLHLHDIRGFDDHYAPGCGDFDFSALKPFIPDTALRVVEAHAKSTPEQVKNSISCLEKAGIYQEMLRSCIDK